MVQKEPNVTVPDLVPAEARASFHELYDKYQNYRNTELRMDMNKRGINKGPYRNAIKTDACKILALHDMNLLKMDHANNKRPNTAFMTSVKKPKTQAKKSGMKESRKSKKQVEKQEATKARLNVLRASKMDTIDKIFKYTTEMEKIQDNATKSYLGDLLEEVKAEHDRIKEEMVTLEADVQGEGDKKKSDSSPSRLRAQV